MSRSQKPAAGLIVDRARRAFYTRRARAGGVARAKARSRLWQTLNMRFLTERRLRRTDAKTFKEWLIQHGFGKLAAAPLRPQVPTAGGGK